MPEIASQVRVKIDGSEVSKVVQVALGCDIAAGQSGQPEDTRARLDTIVITRKSDASTQFWNWAMNPFKGSYFKGTIEFFDPQEKDAVLRTVSWSNGWVSHYSETVPDTQGGRANPTLETIHVSAQEVDFGGGKVASHWGSGRG